MAVGIALLSTTALVPVSADAQSTAELLDELRKLRERVEELEAREAARVAAEQSVAASVAATSVPTTSIPAASVPAATATAPATPAAVPDNAVRSGDTGVSIALSGQVNRGLMYYDDGQKTELRNVDNSNSSTRVRIVGKAELTDDVRVGTNVEVQFTSNPSNEVNQLNDRGVGANNFTERKLELFVESDTYGRLFVGQGDTASNGTSEVDFSGTTVVGYSGVTDVGGALLFRDATTGLLSGTDVGDAFKNLDGQSRDDRIRYDTPVFYGARGSSSFIEGDRWDVALNYGGTFEGFKIGVAGSYGEKQDDISQLNGSFSVLHADSGISVTAAAGTEDRGTSSADPSFFYGKLGYQRKFFDFGKTAVSIDGYYGQDFNSSGSESTSFGVQFVQKIDSIGTELYVGARQFTFDEDLTDFDDIFTVLSGARVKF